MIRIAGFAIDAAISESHSLPSTVTRYPVERGPDVTDHIRPEPISFTVEGVVSNHPIGVMVDERSKETTSAGLSDFEPVDDARARLEKIRDTREPVKVETNLRVYEDMVLTELEFKLDAEAGDGLPFSATFEQIVFVTNNRTTVRVAIPTGKKKTNLGDKLGLKGKDKVYVYTLYVGDDNGADGSLTKPLLRSTQNGRKAMHFAVYPGSPPADGYVDSKGYHSLFTVEQAEFDAETGVWTNQRGEVVKITPFGADPRISKAKQDAKMTEIWNNTTSNGIPDQQTGARELTSAPDFGIR